MYHAHPLCAWMASAAACIVSRQLSVIAVVSACVRPMSAEQYRSSSVAPPMGE